MRIKNPKFEYRNSKQIQMTKMQMIKTKKKDRIVSRCLVLNFEHLDFEFVSDFGFRASDFLL